MIALIQRVSEASVSIQGRETGRIGRGLLAMIGVERDDSEESVQRILRRILGYRVFPDADGKMNLGLEDIHGGLLMVPQFTLAADTRKGMRPGFSSGASPEKGKRLFEYLLQIAGSEYDQVQQGQFGADMQVALVNDGPVTFWLT